MIGLAIIGYGYWGKKLFQNFAQLNNCEIFVVADPYDGPTTVDTVIDHKEAFDKEIDAVVIATPTETHYQIAKDALLAGKHIFVEKPFTLNSKEAKELVKLATSKDLFIMVDHLLSYHPAILMMHTFLKTGELGDPLYLHAQKLGAKTRKVENVLWSLAPHDVAIAIELFGIPIKASSSGRSYQISGLSDVVFLDMEFANGIMAHFHYSWLENVRVRKFTVVGTKGTAVFDDRSVKNFSVYINGSHVDYSLDGQPLENACRHFIDCLCEGREPRTNGVQGLEVIKVLEKARRYDA